MTVSAPPATHNAADTRLVEAAGVEFAYRRFGRPAGRPLVLLQHFRGNLDNWDSGLTDALAAEREVILVDQYPAEVAADVNAFLAREEAGGEP
jgi:pimeloyl-ACP methyl ester carboxylesterase